jgi:hypothetical protein
MWQSQLTASLALAVGRQEFVCIHVFESGPEYADPRLTARLSFPFDKRFSIEFDAVHRTISPIR